MHLTEISSFIIHCSVDEISEETCKRTSRNLSQSKVTTEGCLIMATSVQSVIIILTAVAVFNYHAVKAGMNTMLVQYLQLHPLTDGRHYDPTEVHFNLP